MGKILLIIFLISVMNLIRCISYKRNQQLYINKSWINFEYADSESNIIYIKLIMIRISIFII